MSLLLAVEALFRNKRLFLLVTGGVFILALLWVFATPRSYESNASILVENGRSNVLITAGNSNAPTVMRDVTPEELNSELEVLNSRDLLDEVVQPGWGAKPLGSYTPAQVRAHNAAVTQVSKDMDSSVARQSNVLLASITAASPQLAQTELSRLLAGFLARQRDIGRPPGAARFFARQATQYQRELAQAQTAMAQFQKQQQLVSVSDREGALSTRLDALQNELHASEVQMSDLEHRIMADTSVMAALPARQTTQEHTEPLTGALDQLTTQLVTLQNQRTHLLDEYKPGDRMVQEVDAQIAQTQAAIHGAAGIRSAGAASDINPAWQQMQTERGMELAQLNGERARHAILAGQVAQTQAALASTEGLSPQFSALQQKVAELDANYKSSLEKRDEAQIADSMDREDLLNFAVVQSPTLEFKPVHPRPVRDTLVGMITALLLGGVAVFLAESSRDTFANAAELERFTHYPNLATVPRTKSAGAAGLTVPSSRTGSATASASEPAPGAAEGAAVHRAYVYSEDALSS